MIKPRKIFKIITNTITINHNSNPKHYPILCFFSILWLCTLLLPSLAAAPVTQVVLLGTGSPVPDPDRSGPSLAIVVNDSSYLVDCGVGCVRQATKAFQKKGVKALSVSNLKIVFITHLHSDHTLGYPDLMLTPWDHRNKPLEVYGPVGTRAMTESLLQAYKEDIKVRTSGLQGSNPATVVPNVHEIQPGVIYKDSNVTVTAFPVKHGTLPNSFGYKFVTPDKTIVISGDTAPTETIVEQARNADILIHEVYSTAKFAKASSQIQQYLLTFHTSTKQLAEIAGKAKPKLLVPIHKLGYYDLAQGAIAKEIREAGYRGKIADTQDLDIY